MVFDYKRLVRPNILSLEPYRCARDDFKEGILLDANENTHGPSISDLSTSEDDLQLNRYPDPHQLELKQQICNIRNQETPIEGEKVEVENLCLGVGSDESIDALMRCFLTPSKDKLLICTPTYGMYGICATINDIEIVKCPLNLQSFQIQPEEILKVVQNDPTIKLLYLTSPGNPTGQLIDFSLVETILNAWEGGIVILDEAYIDFSPVGSSRSTLVNKYPNLIVLQTLSKAFGLAGIRLGITFASKPISALLNALKYPYNISNLTSNIALRATLPENVQEMRSKCKAICNEREFVIDSLTKLPNVGRVIGGLDANFILLQFLDTNGKPSNEVAKKLYTTLATENKVVIRYRGSELGCEGCLRISIGTREENNTLIDQMSKVLPQVIKSST
ncbi:Histidinol-phosphate aminotransferase [Komagataella phaffii CBS 7435]|uniref:histidinol-phosphate transaminase n=3 Tax=Komagataella TaxID=460517 RepID=C4R1F7_KOMPG|nr:Histidinol-phosphate aminotransferase, catalyzes the seventh step in histidine biosynthesis [Komagataella phaffii GS115]AAT07971.1 histidinol-phosphate aminotransferase [Komagataella pastoris]AOA62592.1 GQ67_00749T0 [Komagataella phaffii]CAH2448139.1 Histidinol-phosphate aminotransferase [Komagataella phaffii CBS 7435]AOA67901.1 GQ68_00640T0 [Komagataella phaffii GS115]CAY69331.1 Histidinol-phosphate aminotransferase, catalyzes the seventh step in histidine biosynthesis [Komagataella phaffi